MELKAYLQILLRKWWIVIPAFLVTFTSGVVFTYMQTPIYSTSSTYIVVPSSSFSDVKSFTSGLDMLGRRDEIATTFSEIGSSRTIKRRALDSLGIESGRDYTVKSKLRAGTNIIELTIKGPDPVIVQKLADAVGNEIEAYVQSLYEVFVLLPLDKATLPISPTSPNKTLNMILAIVFGLVLGGSLALLSAYLETPAATAESVNIIDEDTGVYNKAYFLQRLGEEMTRAKRNGYPLSVALMKINNFSLLQGANVRTEVLRQIALLISQYIRDEDFVARYEDNIFALLLPDMTGKDAKALMEYMQIRTAWVSFQSPPGGQKINIKSAVGIAAFSHNELSREEFLNQAKQALQVACIGSNGEVYLLPDTALAKDSHT